MVSDEPSQAGVTATCGWSPPGGHPFVYEVDTFDETTGSGGASYPNQGPATNVDLSSPVTANDTWRIVLQNIETGFGATDLIATIAWP